MTTSTEALQQFTGSGHRQSHADLVLSVLRTDHGLTIGEIAAALELQNVQVQRRLNDLEDSGLATVGDPRKCSVSGRRCQVWLARKKQMELFQ
jgi:predicted ArsR family transcriptional regulator